MGRGLPILGAEAKMERKGRSAAEVCTSEARKIGEAPCAARSGQSPLAYLALPLQSRPETWLTAECDGYEYSAFGHTTMLYALERDSDHGSTFAVLVELSEGRDVCSGPVPRVWDLTSHSVPLDQSLQRDWARRPRGSKQSPA